MLEQGTNAVDPFLEYFGERQGEGDDAAAKSAGFSAKNRYSCDICNAPFQVTSQDRLSSY